MKVVTVVGTRPEIIRLSETIKQLDTDFQHVLIHTGQNYNYELNQTFFADLDLREPDHYLDASSTTALSTIAQILSKIEPVLIEENPDAFLVLGDTNSCLAALAAKRLKIPIFHLEAGNRCFDDRVPEEINRRIIDHISDINLTYSDISREYLLREGLNPEQVIKVGSPMQEVLSKNHAKSQNSSVLEDLGLKKGEYFVASFHREENVESPKNLEAIVQSLNHLAENSGYPIIVTTHPRTKKRLAESQISTSKRVVLHPPFNFSDYVKLQTNALLVLSDSGTITEESSILGFTAINIRSTHERPEGFEEASVILAGKSTDSIVGAANLAIKHKVQGITMKIVDDYKVDNFSQKVSRIIQSYTPYINERVWHK
jgi:UDP-N-acetylglucosamine 2-epimerase (non-hydrolysing)